MTSGVVRTRNEPPVRVCDRGRCRRVAVWILVAGVFSEWYCDIHVRFADVMYPYDAVLARLIPSWESWRRANA
jgi:hypothetical protein